MGTNSSSPEGHSPPIFGPYLLRPNGCMDQDATWYGARSRPRRLCLMGTPLLPPRKEGGAPKFSAHVYCGQTAGWIKMVLGMEVCLSPGDFVLDGEPSPTGKGGGARPQFPPISIVAKRLDASRCNLECRYRPQPRGLCVIWEHSPLNFRPMFIIVIVISLEHCAVVIGLFKKNRV